MMLLSKSLLLILSTFFIIKGQCLSIQPATVTLPSICATVLCAFPDCPNPTPPAKGQCCPTCPPTGPIICPPDKPLVNCFVDPCMFAKCPNHPSAVCVADYCGGCNARFFIGKEEVTETCSSATVCKYNGNVYEIGESFPSDDGCNKCTCGAGGIVACTKKLCIDFCVRDGVKYNVGDTFPAGDGCNTCTCLAGGNIACTEIACPSGCVHNGVSYEVGDTFPAGDGCNTCGCIRPDVVVCTLIACQCPVKGQVFKECGSACPANCTTPNPICTRQCVARCECPAGKVIDEKNNECVPRDQCPGACPPVCTASFCSKNKWAKCTIPGPREIPGCTGTCQFTFCSACYISEDPLPLPGSCSTCGSPISSEICYKNWARCIGIAHPARSTAKQTEVNFRCYRYPCQLRG